MHINELPKFIRNSTVLTVEDLALLCQQERMPSDFEIQGMRDIPEIQDLLNAFIGDDSSRDIHLQLHAKTYLQSHQIEEAWKILLL